MSILIECVPNFSEGRDMNIINQITAQIESVEGVKLLDVDAGKATNRTVVTFVGNPDAVVEAAFLAYAKAAELIDMRQHKGEHPRMGAVDVCPFIPIGAATMAQAVACSQRLAQKVGEKLGVSVFLYEYSATKPENKNLATIRAGEYEAMKTKLTSENFNPDFGTKQLNEKFGVSAIGARDFLVAYNINLNTTSVRRANSVAFDVREQGRIVREGDDINGAILKDANGEAVRKAGACKSVKGIGWYIAEYGVAQVSMNLTNINDTPLHIAFEQCCLSAERRGMRVTGSELVGLVPLKVLLDAGAYFLEKQQRSIGVSENELIKIAVKTMGLDELSPFIPEKKIIEYQLKNVANQPLIHMSLTDFADETASESPAPGGGSIAAYMGVLGVSLATMVANLSSHKRGWDEQWQIFSDWAAKGQSLKSQLLQLVDEDTNAFNKIMAAFALSKNTEIEKTTRSAAIQTATQYAVEIPLKTMQLSLESMEFIAKMAEIGNPNSVSDAGVGALAARAAVYGAFLNVKINLSGLKNADYVQRISAEAQYILNQALQKETDILKLVQSKI
jgi:glutamate formiminotransferase / formiminotetrahydrofolate cyclodeaminase